MNILSFDTSGSTLSISVTTKAGNLHEYSASAGFRHSELLLPSVETIMNQAGISFGELDLIVCSRGPGSFTSLRIGMSTAKGLSEGCGAPVVSVSALDCYASVHRHFEGMVVPVIDARKKRFYTALYKSGNKQSEDLDISAEELFERVGVEPVLFTGPDSGLMREFYRKADATQRHLFDPYPLRGIASVMSDLGLARFRNEGPDSPEEGPSYVRLSDAELSIGGEA